MQVLARTLTGLALAAALLGVQAAHAQAAAAPVDAEKQKLIDHILAVWHPENSVIVQVQRPATSTMEQSDIALHTSHVPKDKADKTMKDIAADVQKYVDTVTPIVSNSAKKNLAPTAGAMLAQNFTTDELKQLAAFLDSPVRGKFEKFAPTVEHAIFDKVHADVGAEVDKNINTLQQTVGTKLRLAASMN